MKNISALMAFPTRMNIVPNEAEAVSVYISGNEEMDTVDSTARQTSFTRRSESGTAKNRISSLP